MNAAARIKKDISAVAPALRKLALDVHANPELGFEERKACAWQVEILRRHGFEIENPFRGLETAYLAKSGSGRPAVCFLSEYDALPGLGHACGHNLICAAALGAGIVLSDILQKEGTKGTVYVAGTPAEEGKGGKLHFVSSGIFKGVDAALMAHPETRTSGWNGCLAIERYDATFRGRASHASTAPEKGINALDAVLLLFQGVNAWRQQLPETSRVHGIITKGGDAPNIIPDKASCRFYLRSDRMSFLKVMERRFKDIARGAALMTGAKLELVKAKEGYKAGVINNVLNREFATIAESLGMGVRSSDDGRGSSDFGDVSQELPGIHFYFKAVTEDAPIHSSRFEQLTAKEFALDAMLQAAEALAILGHRILTDKKLRDEAWQDFRNAPK